MCSSDLVTYVNKEKKVYAVRNATFSIEKGDSLGIVGESGSGKSSNASSPTSFEDS